MENVKMHASSVTLYPVDWATVTEVAKENGLASVSAGLRFIIRDWIRLRGHQPAPAPGGNGDSSEEA